MIKADGLLVAEPIAESCSHAAETEQRDSDLAERQQAVRDLEQRFLPAQWFGVDRLATVPTGPDPVDALCRQAAVRVDSNELLLGVACYCTTVFAQRRASSGRRSWGWSPPNVAHRLEALISCWERTAPVPTS